MEIKVKLDEGAFLPERAHATDAGADIRTPYDFTLHSKDSVCVQTGVHVETPPNCVTMVKSKSGMMTKEGIVTDGTVDEGFTGELIVKLFNHGDHPHRFKRGDKVAQLVVLPVEYPSYVQADEISGGERGDAGYGSTGR